MIYRNGIKEYSLSFLIFGGCMGIFFGIVSRSIPIGLLCGLFSGLLFALLMWAITKLLEIKFNKKRKEIAKKREIICDGGATIQGSGGWMYLSKQGLEFYPHKINISTEPILIPITNILGADVQKNKLVIATSGNRNIIAVVAHAKEWKMHIDECVASYAEYGY